MVASILAGFAALLFCAGYGALRIIWGAPVSVPARSEEDVTVRPHTSADA